MGLNFYNLYIRVKVFFQLINKGLVRFRLMKSATFNTQGGETLCRYHKLYEFFILVLIEFLCHCTGNGHHLLRACSCLNPYGILKEKFSFGQFTRNPERISFVSPLNGTATNHVKPAWRQDIGFPQFAACIEPIRPGCTVSP